MKFQKDEVPKIKQKVFEKINENNIGSFYIDQKNNGKLILGITVGTPKSTIEKIKKEINELTTESENVEFIFVENSLIELEELRDKIIEESGNLLNQNIKILDITLNMKFNKLVIGVEDK
ncbi:hypothetical protein [Ureibacillus thermosphaericus]|uniref:hypothetical protein n=1 Tax=Ureibacillus thermosphaericus TaxID=51173 RepID=UPI000BBB8797|nr:hypothetical protein [Ureibacillus thermosphaericus]